MAVSPTQILIIALVVVLLFGASRIADIGKGLGEGIKNFKKGLSDEPDGDKAASKAQAPAQMASAQSEGSDSTDSAKKGA